MSKTTDILDEMTRAELVHWIRSQRFLRPKRSEILYIRWNAQSLKAQADRTAELKVLDTFDFTHRTQLWADFHAEPDRKKKEQILAEIQDFNERHAAHQERWKVLERRQNKIDKLYDQIEIARNAERNRLAGAA